MHKENLILSIVIVAGISAANGYKIGRYKEAEYSSRNGIVTFADCSDPPGIFLPVEDNCMDYYLCINGQHMQLTCGVGNYFYEEGRYCLKDTEYVCNPRPTIEPVETTTLPQAVCTPDLSGTLLPIAGECYKYQLCINDESVILQCPVGLLFSEELQYCVADTEGICWNLASTSTEGSTSSTLVVTSTTEESTTSTEKTPGTTEESTTTDEPTANPEETTTSTGKSTTSTEESTTTTQFLPTTEESTTPTDEATTTTQGSPTTGESTTTTILVPSTTEEPITTTKESTTMTEEPTRTTAEQSTTNTEEPPTTPQAPSTSEASTITEEPPTTTQAPTTFTTDASTTEEPTTTTTEQSTTDAEEPQTTPQAPSTTEESTTEEPQTTTQAPTTFTTDASTTEEPTTTTTEQSTTDTEEPPTTTQAPTTFPTDESTTEEPTTTTTEQSTTNTVEPPTTPQAPSTTEQSTTDTEEPPTTPQAPSTAEESTTTEEQQTTTQAPTTSNTEESTTVTEELPTTTQTPATTVTEEPPTTTQAPSTTEETTTQAPPSTEETIPTQQPTTTESANPCEGIILGPTPHEDCDKYYYCTNEVGTVQICPEGNYFDPSIELCTPDVNGVCLGPCANSPTGTRFPDDENCQWYFECQAGEEIHESCQQGYYFDGPTLECVEDVDNTCGSSDPTMCRDQADGTMIPHSECGLYYVCNNNEAIVENCEFGYRFDVQQSFCVIDPTFSCFCEQNSQAVFEGGACNEYYECDNGLASIHTCPEGEYFESTAMSCVPDENDACLINISTTPPTTEEPITATEVSPTTEEPNTTPQSPSTIEESTTTSEGPTTTQQTATTTESANPCEGIILGPAPHEDCDKYYYCTNEVGTVQICPEGNYFDPSIELCTPDVNGVCLGRCAASPTGTRFPDDDNCQWYFECQAGEDVLLSCQQGYYFDSSTLSCVEDVDDTCDSTAPTICQGQADGKMLPHGECGSYYVCDNNEAVVENCEFGFRFDVQQSFCIVDPTFSCFCQLNSQAVFAGDACNEYYECDNGQALIHDCPQGEYFEATAMSCASDESQTCLITISTTAASP